MAISIHLAFDAGRVWCHACERLTVAGVFCAECGKRHEDGKPAPKPKKCPRCETWVSTRYCSACGWEAQSEVERRVSEGESQADVVADIAARSRPGVEASLAKFERFLAAQKAKATP